MACLHRTRSRGKPGNLVRHEREASLERRLHAGGSIRADPDSPSDGVFSNIGSLNKSPAVDSQGKAGGRQRHSSDDIGPAKFIHGDAGGQDFPPSLCSSDGGASPLRALQSWCLRHQGPQRLVHRHLRRWRHVRSTPAHSYVVLQPLAAYPLIFFVFTVQAAAAWISDGLMSTGFAVGRRCSTSSFYWVGAAHDLSPGQPL